MGACSRCKTVGAIVVDMVDIVDSCFGSGYVVSFTLVLFALLSFK